MTLTGAAPEMTAVWQASKLRGETQKGLHLCGQWPTVWVTSYRGLRGLECVPEKGCILVQHIATGQVAVVCEKGAAVGHWLLAFGFLCFSCVHAFQPEIDLKH
jgi:hypothetical protein